MASDAISCTSFLATSTIEGSVVDPNFFWISSTDAAMLSSADIDADMTRRHMIRAAHKCTSNALVRSIFLFPFVCPARNEKRKIDQIIAQLEWMQLFGLFVYQQLEWKNQIYDVPHSLVRAVSERWCTHERCEKLVASCATLCAAFGCNAWCRRARLAAAVDAALSNFYAYINTSMALDLGRTLLHKCANCWQQILK